MIPHTHLLEGLATHLGSALAFADDHSELQQQVIDSGSTSATFNSVARSFMIGALRKSPIADYQLSEHHTDLNKVEMLHLETRNRFWLKSATAVSFTFEHAEPLFSFPSEQHVLTFTFVGTDVEFQYAPISRLKSKRYKLESPLVFLTRLPLGGSVRLGGYPSSRVDGIFDAGPVDDFNDLLGNDESEGAGEGTA